MCCGIKWTWLLAIVTGLANFWVANAGTLNFQMPKVRASQNDDYLCHSLPLNESTVYITGFEPIYNPNVTHHMIIFRCAEPGSAKSVWKCGSMNDAEGSVCEGFPSIVFAWAMNAPSFKMPLDVSFQVGKGTPYDWLVLQIHYKDVSMFSNAPEFKDESGIKMTVQSEPTKKLAGVYLSGTGGEVAANGITELSTACLYTGHAILHPFAYRVHAHSHGVINEAFRIRNGRKQLIGSKSPQEHQTFYLMNTSSVVIRPYDMLMARCIMRNNENRVIPIGNTRKDEMCNFYMMYWVYKSQASQIFDEDNQQCFSDGTIDMNKFLSRADIDDLHRSLELLKPPSFPSLFRDRHYYPEDMEDFEADQSNQIPLFLEDYYKN